MSNQSMNVGQLLKQANQLKRVGKLDKAIASSKLQRRIESNFSH